MIPPPLLSPPFECLQPEQDVCQSKFAAKKASFHRVRFAASGWTLQIFHDQREQIFNVKFDAGFSLYHSKGRTD